MKATRYSGFLTVTIRLDDFDDYHFSVSHDGRVIGRGKTRPPHAGTIDNKTGRRISDDSPIAFDQVAHAALSFVSDEADDGDLIESLADFDGSGYIITRRKPVRSAAKNGRSRLKRTKLACTRRSNATRKGSSKAASRLATHCPKRRSRKAR